MCDSFNDINTVAFSVSSPFAVLCSCKELPGNGTKFGSSKLCLLGSDGCDDFAEEPNFERTTDAEW